MSTFKDAVMKSCWVRLSCCLTQCVFQAQDALSTLSMANKVQFKAEEGI